VEKVSDHGYRILLLVGELDFRGIEVGVEFAADDQSCAGRGAGDEVDDGLVGLYGSSAPVLGDSGEEPVFDLVKAPG
jgi:hypothetical protein